MSDFTLNINDLDQVLEVLDKYRYSGRSFYKLGLYLGLSKDTIDIIENDHKGDTNRCLLECISAWLSKKDKVESKGGATWISLKDALKKLRENAIADGIEKDKISVACAILSGHHSKLSQSIHTPLDIASTLHREGILSQESLNTVESTRGTVQRIEVLLSLVYEAVSINHKCMETFVSVLRSSSHTVPVADDILKEYMAHYTDYSKVEVMSDNDDAASTHSATDSKGCGTVNIPKSWSHEFSSIRTKFADMFFEVRTAISKDFGHSSKDLKDYLYDGYLELRSKLDNVQTVHDILSIVREQCTLTDITLLEAITQMFGIKEAEECIKKYKEAITSFCNKVKVHFCFKETFQVVHGPTPLICETITFVLDWDANQYTIAEVKNVIGEALGRDSNVQIKVILSTNSIKVVCTFPVSLTGLLISRASKKLELLKKKGLLLLTIGYYTLYDHKAINEEVSSLEKRLKLAEEEKNMAVQEKEELQTTFLECQKANKEKIDSLENKLKLAEEKRDVAVGDLQEKEGELSTQKEMMRKKNMEIQYQIDSRNQELQEVNKVPEEKHSSLSVQKEEINSLERRLKLLEKENTMALQEKEEKLKQWEVQCAMNKAQILELEGIKAIVKEKNDEIKIYKSTQEDLKAIISEKDDRMRMYEKEHEELKTIITKKDDEAALYNKELEMFKVTIREKDDMITLYEKELEELKSNVREKNTNFKAKTVSTGSSNDDAGDDEDTPTPERERTWRHYPPVKPVEVMIIGSFGNTDIDTNIEVSRKLIPDELKGSDEWMNREIDDLVAKYEKNQELHHRILPYRDFPGKERSREYYLDEIKEYLTNSTVPGVGIYYTGHGEKDTGNWCFKDGVITFQDMFDIYMEYYKGKPLTIASDCSYSGNWINECAKTLDRLGIPSCGHHTRKNDILFKINVSCLPNQEATALEYLTGKAVYFSKIDKAMIHQPERALSSRQTAITTDFRFIHCNNLPNEQCELDSTTYTWEDRLGNKMSRIRLVHREDKGKPVWYYVLVDEDKIKLFEEARSTSTLNISDYGRILDTGAGLNPSIEDKRKIELRFKEYKPDVKL